jgi:antitoxin ParD1/3/4
MPVNVKTRNVSLTPEIEAFIDGRVASGRFRSASEVVRAALRLLEEDERRRETRGQRGRHPDRSARAPADLKE